MKLKIRSTAQALAWLGAAGATVKFRRCLTRVTEPTILFPAITILVLGVVWGTTLNLIKVERAAAERAAAVSSDELAETYEARVVRVLREIDLTLKFVKYAYEHRGKQALLQELKDKSLLPPSLLFVVSIADSTGDVVASTKPSAVANVADQDYFQIPRQVDSLSIGRPPRGPSAGEDKLHFSRRLDTADGRFAGIVTIAVDAAYFVSSYETSKLGEHGVLGVLGVDGVFRARRTGEAVSAGDTLDYIAVVPAANQASREAMLSTNAWDGVPRYTSARQLYEFPLAVIVGLSADEQLAATRSSQHTYLWRAAAGSLVLILIAVVLSRMSRQLAIESTERQKAEEKYRAIFEHATEGIFQISLAGRIISANLALAGILGYDTPEQLQETVGDIATEVYIGSSQHSEALALLVREESISQVELAARRKNGSQIWVSVTARLVRDADGTILFYEGTMHDVTRRRQTESALHKAQADLVTSAHLAGMAKIATNVLHNVGNVLNSVNVSAALILSNIRTSKIQGFTRAVQLMAEHANDLAAFLASDAKGKLLPGYLRQLAPVLVAEQQGTVEELMALVKNVDHVKEIIAAQQVHAGASMLLEKVQIGELLEDALQINAAALALRHVVVEQDIAPIPELQLNKGRILQILVNLIGNAEQAMEGMTDREPKLTLRVDVAPGQRLRIRVADNGMGIAPETLAKLFAHGFTTKKTGHGFGLHSAVNAASEMGGTLTAHSDGPDTGATFTLELPIKTTEELP